MIELVSLTKEVRKDIAEKINSLVVAEMMKEAALKTENYKGIRIWRQSEIEATLYLLDKYNIRLPNAESFDAERTRNAA